MEWSNPLAEAQWALPQRNGICSIFAVMGLDERNGSPNKLQLPKRRRNERGKILQLQDPPLLIFQAAQATLVIYAPCGSKESRLHQLLPKKHGRELTGSPQADPTATSFSIPWTDNDQTTDCQLQSPPFSSRTESTSTSTSHPSYLRMWFTYKCLLKSTIKFPLHTCMESPSGGLAHDDVLAQSSLS
jgi:hypothetical protein